MQDKLIDYVLGSLTPQEEQAVVAYLKEHPEEAAKVRDLFEMMTDFALAQPPILLAESAEEDLLKRIRRDGKPSKQRRWWLGAALAAALAVFAYLNVWPQGDPIARQLAAVCSEPAVVCDPLTDDTGAPLGTIAKWEDNRLFVVLEKDPRAGQVYQAWNIVDGTPESIGIWEGRVIDIATPLSEESTFGITVEPAGGSPQPTSTPIVALPLSS